MKLKHLFLVCAAALFAVACSDDDEGGSKISGPLATPSNVVYTPTESSIHFEWGKVTNATSYEATLAPEDTPSSKETIQTTSTQCDFENLEAGYYIFTVTALYADNPAYNSAAYEMRVATLGLGVDVLDTPGNLKSSNVGSHEATVSWDAVNGAAAYGLTAVTGGTEVVNEIVSGTSYTFTDLESGATFTVSVKALLLATGETSEFDSPAASVTFTTIEGLIAPTVKEVVTTYGMSIMEWDLTSAAQAQQAISSTDPYDFRIADANGNVIRLIENCCSWNFNRYSYKRISFGGLEANTTYQLGIRRLSSSSSYGASEWTNLKITTTAAPDKTGYLLYWDFENVPFCANAQYRAYGFKYNGNTETDYSDPNALDFTGVSNEAIWGEKIDPTANSKHNNQSFFDNYFPGLTVDDFVNGTCFNVAACVGMLKFGGSSQETWLALPALKELTSPTDILVEFDASPYYEPGATGNKYEINNPDVMETFKFEVTGDGTIDSSSLEQGESDTGKIATLKLPTLEEGTALGWGDDRYYFAPKSVVVKDATSSTRIKLYTVAISGVAQQRMWMDNIRISVYTGE